MNTIRLGIIGLGNMGTSHAMNVREGLIPGIQLAAIADRKPARRDYAHENWPDVALFDEGLALINRADVDAVLIAVPHYQHAPLTIAGLDRGLHVMCEKPASVYTLAARDMIRAADAHNDLTFGMMFNQRTNCVYREMKRIVESGELGAMRRMSWIVTDWMRTQYYYDSGAWRASWAGEGGGVLLNQCPHNLDLLQWICGLPTLVDAHCHMGKWHDIEVEDDVTAYLEFENGATGVFVTTTGDAPGTNRFEISGDNGKLVCEDDQLTFYRLKTPISEFLRTSRNGFEKPEMEIIRPALDGQNEQHVGVMKAFAGHILGGEPLVANGREGLNGLMLSNAMHLSSWLSKPVTLPIDEALFKSELDKRVRTSKLRDTEDVIMDTRGSYGTGSQDWKVGN